MRSILVLRGGALGDFIVTLPTLAALRQQWPEARIELAGNATAAALARARGLIDAAHSQHEQRWSTLFQPGALPDDFAAWLRDFDAVINFWPDPEGDLSRRFPLRDGQRFIAAPALPTLAPAAEHYIAALRPLGVADVPIFFALKPRPRSQIPPMLGRAATPLAARLCSAAAVAEQARSGVHARPVQTPATRPIAIHPGSGSVRKNWPTERWLELIGAIPGPVLLILGEVEVAAWSIERLATTVVAPRLADGSLRLATNLRLEALVDELAGCRLFLGHDSGVSHLAAACGVPCVLLFGPTDPAMWAPPAPHVRVIRRGPDLAQISTREVIDAVDGGSSAGRDGKL